MQTALGAAIDAHGAHSHEVAWAHYELACVRLGVGDRRRAITALRDAADVEPTTDEGRRDRLTFLVDLGQQLQSSGALDDAEEVLRRSLVGREQLYGRDHSGYAFGQEPLAELLLLRGQVEETATLAESALNRLMRDGNPRAATSLALVAFTRVAAGQFDADEWLGQVASLPDELRSQCFESVLVRAKACPGPAIDVLVAVGRIADQQGDPSLSVRCVAAVAEAARTTGQPHLRVEALTMLVERFHIQRDGSQEVVALQALAIAQGDAGNPEAAEAHYKQALARAVGQGLLPEASNSARNYGLWLVDTERHDEARAVLAQSVQLARTHGGTPLGRALVAQGIQEQHAGALEVARVLLMEALTLLDAVEPDALPARSHLQAIETDRSCGCGEMDMALSDALVEMVRPELPEGLLEDLTYEPRDDGTMGLSIRLAREPEPGELEHLNRVVNQAVATLQQRLKQQGYARPNR